MVTMVLLKGACMCTMPEWTTRFSFFLKLFFFVGFAGACAIRLYCVLDVAFFLLATVPRRGPLRVRALVCVRWPRTGRPRRCRMPREEPISIRRLVFME